MNREHEEIREIDRWLRKAAFIGTISSFLIGWGSGVFTTYLFFKNHELRISLVEASQKEQDHDIKILEARQVRVLQTLKEKLRADIP